MAIVKTTGQAFYGSSNSDSVLISEFYGMTGEISNVSGVVDTGTIFTGLDGSAFANNIMDLANPKLTSAPTKIEFAYDQTSDSCSLNVITSTGTSNIFNGQPSIILYIRSNKLGLTGLSTWVQSYIEGDPKPSVQDSITVTANFNSNSTLIKKLYGSIGGRTKLVCQNFGHVDYTYGKLTYYINDDLIETATIPLKTQAEVESLRGSGSTWSVTIDGHTVQNTKIKSVSLNQNVDFAIPSLFLRNCTNLESIDISNTKTTTIGQEFLYQCSKLNCDIDLPQTLTAIGTSFLGFCRSLTGTINVGNLDASIASSSSYTFATVYNWDPCYTVGIKIAGNKRSTWFTQFPNSDSGTLRKLIDANY